MTNHEHQSGYGLNWHEYMPDEAPHPYPLGIPRRIIDALHNKWIRLARDVFEPLFNPHEATHLTPSDVPGVLLAAGPVEIFLSLARIGQHMGPAAAERAYLRILARALADGQDGIAAALTEARQQYVHEKHDPLR